MTGIECDTCGTTMVWISEKEIICPCCLKLRKEVEEDKI